MKETIAATGFTRNPGGMVGERLSKPPDGFPGGFDSLPRRPGNADAAPPHICLSHFSGGGGIISEMTEPDDTALLAAWVSESSQEAFAALARRYTGLLYHAGLRQTGRAELAQEAAQNALAILARKAARVSATPSLAPWLHRTACFEAARLLRRDRRHEDRMKALHLTQPGAGDDSDPWEKAAPVLDAALDSLPEADRQVLLLRYFDGWTFEWMAERLGGTAAAWRQRGSRALERLRGVFAKKGVSLSLAALTTGLGGSLAQAAPPTVATALAAAPLAAGSLSWKTLALHSLHTMNIKQAAVLAGTAAVALVPLGFQYNAVADARARVVGLETSVASLRELVTPAGEAAGTASVVRGAKAPGRGPKTDASGGIDLVALADMLIESRGDGGNMLKMIAFEKTISAMDADILEGLVFAAARLELTAEKKQMLLQHLLSRLARQDKTGSRVLKVIADIGANAGGSAGTSLWSQHTGSLGLWARKDPAAAQKWLEQARKDGLFEDGSLDNSDFILRQMQSYLFAGLHRSDRAAAMRLFDGMTEADRAEAINTLGSELVRSGNQEELRDLVSGLEKPASQRAALANTVGHLSMKSLADTRAFIDAFSLADRDRRELMITAASAGFGGPSGVEKIRERIDWLRDGVSADERGKAVGYFLGSLRRFDPEGARRALEAELENGVDDELLGAYIRRSALSRGSMDDSLRLVQRLSDESERARTLREVTRPWPPQTVRDAARSAGVPESEIEAVLQQRSSRENNAPARSDNSTGL